MKKILSLVISGLLVGSLMVGCSSSNTNNKAESSIKEEKHMTEEERIASLQGLEGDELTEAFKNLLNKDEIKYIDNEVQENGWTWLEQAEQYKADGTTTKTSTNYNGNEVEAEKYIAEQLDNIEKTYIDDELFPRFEFTWTNNTGNDINYLEIDFKEYDKDNACIPWNSVEQNISAGETRKITLYLKEKTTERIEITGLKIYHPSISDPDTIYDGCIPGKWYELGK